MGMIGGILAGQSIAQAGVKCVFTLCGGHVAPIYIGLQMNGVRLIDTRHEAAAAHAADAWGRLTGIPGVAIVTAGPGVTNAVTGIANAYEAESPMVVIGGKVGMARLDQGSLQEMDQVSLLSSITKWRACVYDTGRIPEYLARAFHIANTGRRGTRLSRNADRHSAQSGRSQASRSQGARSRRRPVVGRSANGGKVRGDARGVASSGDRGGRRAALASPGDALDRLVRAAKIPVYLNGLGRGALPHGHPNFLSFTRKQALAKADLIILVGAEADFRLGYARGFNKDAKVVMIESDKLKMGFNVEAQLALVGNSKFIMEQITGALDSKKNEGPRGKWLAEMRSMEDDAVASIAEEMASDIFPVNPYRFGAEVAKVVDENTIIIGDGGNIVATTSKVVKLAGQKQWMDPGKFGCLGVGMPFALAAQVAYPDKRVLVVFGDGSVGFNGFEIDTAVRHNLPIVGVVGNDAAWTQIRAAQLESVGEDFAAATLLAPTRYDEFAKSLGGNGYHVESADQIAPTIEKAFAAGKPAIVNVPLNAELNGRGCRTSPPAWLSRCRRGS
ncbi:MAG: thiamine pyrophosphate-binding protein [Deltaproteobacteria bacterium]|nr:thiamine pyrophosphate-binding protein [Deltaproteobacteria bacterium]